MVPGGIRIGTFTQKETSFIYMYKTKKKQALYICTKPTCYSEWITSKKIYIFQQSPVHMRGSKQFDYKQKKNTIIWIKFFIPMITIYWHILKKNGKFQAPNNEQSYALIFSNICIY